MNTQSDDHDSTVVVGSDGQLSFTSDQINTVKLDNKIVKALPTENDVIVSLTEHKDKFRNLEFIDLLLTNACNLSCTYCYEQHNKDFGRFTPELIKKTWDFLKNINDLPDKYIQFFGGEPLIHKKLILQFLRDNREEIEAMAGKQTVSITTNGLLLNDDFIDEYFSYPGVRMMISLDTVDYKLDHRGIKEEQMQKLLNNIEKVCSKVDDPQNFAIRATIGREVAPYLHEFWEELYKRGVRQLIFHPLILSYGQGYVEWTQEEWDKLCSDIKEIITKSKDVVHFQVAEGVGRKGKTNCLVGSDEIAIDPSGDFSGCYFFTNRKAIGTGQFLLGNIFDDVLYLNRYEDAVNAYADMYEKHEECKTCHVQDLCYQCPAGNASTGNGDIFRPDGMCKRFVELYADIAHLNLTKLVLNDILNLFDDYKERGDDALLDSLKNIHEMYFGSAEAYQDYKEYLTAFGGAETPKEAFEKLCMKHCVEFMFPAERFQHNVDATYVALMKQVIETHRLTDGEKEWQYQQTTAQA